MKRIVLLTLISFYAIAGYSNSFSCAWDSYGIATRYNYNVGYSYGTNYYRGVGDGVAIGLQDIVQQFSLNYTKENGNIKGNAMSINCNYEFFCPSVTFQLDKSGRSQAYVCAGVGYLYGGVTSLHKWNNSNYYNNPSYDSTLNQFNTFNLLTYRIGVGFTQYYALGGNFHLFLSEDAGFIPTPLANVSDPSYADFKTNVAQLLQPTYISIRIGVSYISHSKGNTNPYKIYY